MLIQCFNRCYKLHAASRVRDENSKINSVKCMGTVSGTLYFYICLPFQWGSIHKEKNLLLLSSREAHRSHKCCFALKW